MYKANGGDRRAGSELGKCMGLYWALGIEGSQSCSCLLQCGRLGTIQKLSLMQ